MLNRKAKNTESKLGDLSDDPGDEEEGDADYGARKRERQRHRKSATAVENFFEMSSATSWPQFTQTAFPNAAESSPVVLSAPAAVKQKNVSDEQASLMSVMLVKTFGEQKTKKSKKNATPPKPAEQLNWVADIEVHDVNHWSTLVEQNRRRNGQLPLVPPAAPSPRSLPSGFGELHSHDLRTATYPQYFPPVPPMSPRPPLWFQKPTHPSIAAAAHTLPPPLNYQQTSPCPPLVAQSQPGPQSRYIPSPPAPTFAASFPPSASLLTPQREILPPSTLVPPTSLSPENAVSSATSILMGQYTHQPSAMRALSPVPSPSALPGFPPSSFPLTPSPSSLWPPADSLMTTALSLMAPSTSSVPSQLLPAPCSAPPPSFLAPPQMNRIEPPMHWQSPRADTFFPPHQPLNYNPPPLPESAAPPPLPAVSQQYSPFIVSPRYEEWSPRGSSRLLPRPPPPAGQTFAATTASASIPIASTSDTPPLVAAPSAAASPLPAPTADGVNASADALPKRKRGRPRKPPGPPPPPRVKAPAKNAPASESAKEGEAEEDENPVNSVALKAVEEELEVAAELLRKRKEYERELYKAKQRELELAERRKQSRVRPRQVKPSPTSDSHPKVDEKEEKLVAGAQSDDETKKQLAADEEKEKPSLEMEESSSDQLVSISLAPSDEVPLITTGGIVRDPSTFDFEPYGGWWPTQADKWKWGTYINCDLRYYNLASLGKFDVVLVDPPWRIRGNEVTVEGRTMFTNSKFSLEYGTMSNEEILDLDVGSLSDKGFIFLWVINSQMQFGYDLLAKWGYTYADRLVWVKKTSQSNVAIGQGFYFLHSTETVLVGVKCPKGESMEYISKVNNDLIFAEMRKKSQKPDQLYAIIEAMNPGSRKLEIFARNHNIRPTWLSLGNQLGEYYDWTHDRISCDACHRPIVSGNTRYKSRQTANKDLCHSCFESSGAKEEDYFPIENILSEMAFHEYFECDSCHTKPIWGIRFNCLECQNLDLCEACYDSRYCPADCLEHKSHVFKAIELPDLAGGLPLHKVRCNGCFTLPIVGYRFVCELCPSFSLCQKCHFKKKEPRGHLETHPQYFLIEPDDSAYVAKCDCCGKTPILENRYKCNSCFMYEVCEKCYLSNAPPPMMVTSHRPSHKFTMLRGPHSPKLSFSSSNTDNNLNSSASVAAEEAPLPLTKSAAASAPESKAGGGGGAAEEEEKEEEEKAEQKESTKSTVVAPMSTVTAVPAEYALVAEQTLQQ